MIFHPTFRSFCTYSRRLEERDKASDSLACARHTSPDSPDVFLRLWLTTIDVSQVMTARIMERGLSSGRIDDNEDAIRKRLITYRESTMPIIKDFQARGKLREVNSDQTVGEKRTESIYKPVNPC